MAGKSYPDGSYVIKCNQAFRPHILDLFEPQDHPNDFAYPGGPPIAPYDAAGWTLAYTMGIRFDRILDAFNGPFQRIPYGELQTTPQQPQSGKYNAHSNASFTTINDLLKAGKSVYRASRTGDFYTTAHGADMEKIHPARIALCDVYGGSIPAGWVRFILEQYHFPADIIYPQTIDAGNLNGKYDVIIFVTGIIPSPTDEGYRYSRTGPIADSIPAELRMNLDTAIQPTWGMDSVADVYFDQSPVFHIDPQAAVNGSVRPIAWFAAGTPLRSGWAWGQAYLQDGVAAFEATIGKGKLYAFGPEITFRSQTHGTFKLLFNQLYK